MKNIFKLIICTLIFSFINVNAATLTFEGPDKIQQGTSGNQKIMLNTAAGEKISKVEFELDLDANYTSYGVSKTSYILGELKLGKSILSANSGSTLSGELGTLTVTNNTGNNNLAIIKIKNIIFTYEDNSTQVGIDYSKQITLTTATTAITKPKSNNASLSNLTFSVGNITPKFVSNINNYKVFGIKDTIKTITINPTCDNCTTTIKCELGCNNVNNQYRPSLEIGKNIIKISTLSESANNTMDYIITIYRGETIDNSSFLSDIEIDGFKLNEKFKKKNLDYTLEVPNDITELVIKATPEDNKAKVEIRGNDNLIVGDNVLTITVTSSETEDVNIYNITVTKLEVGEIMGTTTPVIEKEDGNNLLLIIVIVLGGLAIIGTSAYFIFFKKKKNDKNKPEIITDQGNIKKKSKEIEVSTKENELIDDLNMTDKKIKPTIDEALADLMTTKELLLEEK
ncbi:MAG: cadherin-like beta sandwich domain-containing protein [Bacilli bacterium]|nr:cadherin-like beta sandwich domain-containing protein [Bacilli bacterium]MDD4406732.1 cadherin-like beta sandwich domain-containing protein [Bacilli bacterium]